MTLGEAQQVIAALPRLRGDQEYPAVAIPIEAYESTPSAERKQLIVTALVTLLLEGDDREQDLACSFFRNGAADMASYPEHRDLLWQELLDRRAGWATPIGLVAARLTPPSEDLLRRVRDLVLKAPQLHPNLFIHFFDPDHFDEEVWQALCQLVRGNGELDVVSEALRCVVPSRHREVARILAERPEGFVDEVLRRSSLDRLKTLVKQVRTVA